MSEIETKQTELLWTNCKKTEPPKECKLFIKHRDKIHCGTFKYTDGNKFYFHLDSGSAMYPRPGTHWCIVPRTLIDASYIEPLFKEPKEPKEPKAKAEVKSNVILQPAFEPKIDTGAIKISPKLSKPPKPIEQSQPVKLEQPKPKPEPIPAPVIVPPVDEDPIDSDYGSDAWWDRQLGG